MNTALSIIDAITPNTDIDYRQEMNVIHEIVAECEKEIAFMHQVLHIREQMEVFKQLPDLPITDGHVQQVINSHEKGWAMIVPCKITYELAKEVQANRARSKEE